MKKNYVDSLVTGSDFDDFFLMKSMAVRVGSNQKKYIDMILGDKTGDVSAKNGMPPKRKSRNWRATGKMRSSKSGRP